MPEYANAEEHDGPRLVLEDFLPYRLMRAFELVSRDFAGVYGERYDLSRPEWRCLATIGQFGRITATGIGRHSSMHKTKVSRAVSALEERRWLRREKDPADRRNEYLTLTDKGRKAYRDLAIAAQAYQRALLQALGDAAPKLGEGIGGLEAALGARKSR